MDLAAQAAGIGALAEPVRRALYFYVVDQPDAVGREEAAAAVDVPVHSAKFHLDRLVDDGLLVVEFRRLTGRSGPGAGRPAKLYRRSDRQFAVSIPARRYDVVGRILAAAVVAAQAGASLPDALRDAAHAEGEKVATESSPAAAPGAGLQELAAVLSTQGYEPRCGDDEVRLASCPFDALAKEYTAMVCGLNRSYVQGVADGLGCASVQAWLEPWPGHCCVTARRSK